MLWNIWLLPHWLILPFTVLSTLGFYFSPNPIPFISPFALAFPVFFIWHLLWTLISVLRLRSASIFGIILIALIYPQAKGIMSYNNTEKKENKVFKIASWNVHHWKNINWSDIELTETKMGNWILSNNPDILCIQENNDTKASKMLRNSFPHHITGKYQMLCIYSKYPILQWDFETYSSGYPGHKGFIWADVEISDPDGNIDTLRITNIHLVTTTFDKKEALSTNKKLDVLKSIYKSFTSLTKTAKKRSQQLDQIIEWKKHSKHPVFISGDFNEVPTSNAYFKMTQNMKDAFSIAGKGLGSTYTNLWRFPLRIDWIICPNEIDVQSAEILDQTWSDHNPIMIEISPFK